MNCHLGVKPNKTHTHFHTHTSVLPTIDRCVSAGGVSLRDPEGAAEPAGPGGPAEEVVRALAAPVHAGQQRLPAGLQEALPGAGVVRRGRPERRPAAGLRQSGRHPGG